MVAMVILTIITTIVFTSYASVANSADLARKAAEDLRQHQFLWRCFTTNLASIHTDTGCEMIDYQLLGEDDDGPFGPADSLRFCTTLPMPGGAALPGVLKVVSFEVMNPEEAMDEEEREELMAMEEEDEREQMTLVITEKPLVVSYYPEGEEEDSSSLLEDEEEPIQRKVPIRSLDIQYYDGLSEEWREEWDSVAEKVFPWALRIKVNFPRTEEQMMEDIAQGIDFDEDPDIDLTIALSVGAGVLEPFIDVNHRHAISGGMMIDSGSGANLF